MTENESESNEYYVVRVNDLFRVDKQEVDSREAAEALVMKRIGTEPYDVHDTEVIDEIVESSEEDQ